MNQSISIPGSFATSVPDDSRLMSVSKGESKGRGTLPFKVLVMQNPPFLRRYPGGIWASNLSPCVKDFFPERCPRRAVVHTKNRALPVLSLQGERKVLQPRPVAARLSASLSRVLADPRQGLTRQQLQDIQAIARDERVVMAYRFVPRGVQNFRGTPIVGKPRFISDHTSDCGPSVGLLPREPALRRQGKKQREPVRDNSLEKLIQQREVRAEPLRMSRNQLDYVIRLGAAAPVSKEDYRKAFDAIDLCRPMSAFPQFRAEREDDGRYMIFVRDEAGTMKELEVLLSPAGERFVADMDPVIVGVPEDDWDEQLDKPCVSQSRLDNGEDSSSDSDQEVKSVMDAEFGNITPRARRIFTRINGKLDMNLIRHGPESLNPHARPDNLFPCLVFNPGLVRGVAEYAIVNSVDDMSRLLEACRLSAVKVPPHPSWRKIPSRRGSLYDALIARDLPQKITI